MAANAKILDLRNILAERFPHSLVNAAGHLQTGVSQLDGITGGGLPKSAITELISSNLSAGSAALIATLLQKACADRYFLALVDGSDSFDAEPFDNSELRNLLWVRCRSALEAVKSADLLLRDGNFPLVIVDVILNAASELRKIPQTNWYRLQRLVEQVPTACLVITRQSMVSSAQLKILLENSWTLGNLNGEISYLPLRIQCAHHSNIRANSA